MGIKLREKLAFSVGDFGGNFVWTFVSSFFMIYLTDTVGLAAGMVGMIMMFARFVDGASDLFMGSIVDRTHSKMGKARPWVFWASFPLAIVLVLLFSVPGSLGDGRYAYVAIFYIVMCLLYTAVNVPYASLTALITSQQKDRVLMTSLRYVFTFIAAIIISFVAQPMVANFGGGQKGWTMVAIVFAIIFLVFNLICVLGTKEKNTASSHGADSKGNKPSLGSLFKPLLTNKYFYVVLGIYICLYFIMGLAGAKVYFATYVFHSPSLFGVMTLATVLPMLVGMFFVTPIVQKMGKRKAAIMGSIITCVGFILIAFAPTNIMVYLVGTVIGSLGLCPVLPILPVVISNISEYVDSKHNVRIEGTAFSVTTVGIKVGTGVGTAIVGVLLTAGGFVPNAAQPASSIFAMEMLCVYLPIILAVISLVLCFMLTIDKYMPQVYEDLKKRDGVSPTGNI